MADNSLKDQAAVIRDETASGKNTATRVGSLLVDMCGSLETAATASALATETAAREGGDKALASDIAANYKLLAGVIDTTIPNEISERKAADAALGARVTTAQETADGLTWLYAVASAECTITINGTVYTVPARKPLRAALPKGTTAISSFTVSGDAQQYLHALRLTGRKVTAPRAAWGYKCAALTSLDLSAVDTSAATTLASLANKAASLRKLTGYEDWDTSKATNMVSAFSNTALTSLDLSHWDTSACTNMQSLFCQSYSLADVGDISQWDTSKVTTIDQIFYGTALTSLDLSGWDLQSCTACTNVFYGCKKLATLKLGAGWGKMPGTPTLDLSPLTAWTEGWATLGLLYNRATAGLGTMTIKLPAAVYAGINELGLIAYLKQAGYTIAKA